MIRSMTVSAGEVAERESAPGHSASYDYTRGGCSRSVILPPMAQVSGLEERGHRGWGSQVEGRSSTNARSTCNHTSLQKCSSSL